MGSELPKLTWRKCPLMLVVQWSNSRIGYGYCGIRSLFFEISQSSDIFPSEFLESFVTSDVSAVFRLLSLGKQMLQMLSCAAYHLKSLAAGMDIVLQLEWMLSLKLRFGRTSSWALPYMVRFCFQKRLSPCLQCSGLFTASPLQRP